MNKIIFSLFIIFYAALAKNSCQSTILSSKTVEGSAVIKDLRELGKEFILSQAMFHTKHPLPHDEFSVLKTYSVERRIFNGVYHFRYNVLILPGNEDRSAEPDPSLDYIVNATYTISFRPSNGKVSVTSYRYSVRFPDREPAYTSDSPFYSEATLEDGPSDDDVDYVVEHAIKDGSLKDGEYSVGKIYSWFRGESVSYDKYLLTLVRSDGYTVRAQIELSGGGDGSDLQIDYVIYTNRL